MTVHLPDPAELQRQKQYYESLLEISPAAIVVTDLELKVVSWNPAAETLFGYTAEEARGRLLDDLVAGRPELRNEAAGYSRAAARGERVNAVARRTRKDGSLVDVQIFSAPVFVEGERTGFVAIYHDISEIQRQKQYYESLVELSPSAIATVDLDGAVTSWNPAAERLFGYTTAEVSGRVLDDLVGNDPQTHEEAVDVTKRIEAGGEVRTVTRRTRKDGSLVDVQVLAKPIVVNGERVGHYAIYHDISELQRQRRYHESLLESSPSAIVTLDLDATINSWNSAAERLFGYSRDEALGRDIDDLIANRADLRREAKASNRAGVSGEQVHLVTRRQRKDGSLVDVDVVGTRIVVSGEPVGIFAIYSDVGELQRQRRYYESLFELSPTAIATVDRDVNVTSWNAAAERLFGYSRDEVLGRNLNDLVANTEELRAEGLGLEHHIRAEGTDVHRITRRVRKDGSLVDVDLRAAPMVVGGETVGMFCLYHDITELQGARLEAEAANQAKSAFLATMSHEIRTPMNAVIGMTELLLGTELDEEQRGFGEVVRSSGEALLSVINDILDFSKIEAGKLDLENHAFDLRTCVESAMELIAPTAAEQGLDLAYLLAPEAPEALVGDAARVRQILLNLLNNAVKFTERGEIVLTVDAEPLAEDGGRRSYRVHFAVRDTGIGIAAERIDSLFESFSQVDASTTRRYGGTGLGLAISRRLADAMGGSIWVESQVGEGSTFHVTIEADEAPRPLRPYDDETVTIVQGKRLLIVDDNATNRQIARAYAESWGMVARDTASPREALEWVRRGDPFDAALLDMQMPELDGVELAREIAAHRDTTQMPLLLLTSLGRREDDGHLFAAHLTKPIRPSQLYNALLGALAGEAGPVAPIEPRAAPVPSAAALRVLVAEDNAVNQRLALLLLQRLGHEADLAGNGVEALEALERRPVDVVLMDVQMPEMDGLEATRRIHERWGVARPRIIAVTAGAMTDERDQCLAAGMDDYLSKPIRMEELAGALAGVRPRRDAPRAELSVERLRETLGDDALGELVDAFLGEAPILLATLREAVEAHDADGLRRAAHSLKASAATFGATPLAELCLRLEQAGQAGNLEGANELVAAAGAEYDGLEPWLQMLGEREHA